MSGQPGQPGHRPGHEHDAPGVGEPMTGAKQRGPLARGAGGRRRLRHPWRRDPAALRPADGLAAVRHILVRHEQGAGHAAEGYAHATGRVGVCMATSGPGATNLVTPIADAYMDSVPMVAITGQVASRLDRHGRLPGGGHLRHHHADHQAQLPGHRRRGDPARASPRRSTSPAPAGPARCSSTSPRTRCRPTTTLRLAERRRPARVPPGDPPARQAGARGGPADRRAPAGRCSTSAAGSSRRARAPSCAASPSSPARPSSPR